MRVIAGKYKSRILKDPTSKRTHPMSEKMRGALFNSLGDITNLNVLDAFSGTGVVGVEAVSRGASHVNSVELDSDAFEVLKQNRDSLTDSESMEIHRANVKSWLKNQNEKFDIVIADPPYDQVGMKAIETCADYVKGGGLFVLSLPQAENIDFENFDKIDEKRYGNAKLVFYKKLK